jgi:hypothetical protein
MASRHIRRVAAMFCAYPRHRINNDHKYQFVPINDSIDQAVAQPAVSIPNQVLRPLSMLASRLNLLMWAAASEIMTKFISGDIDFQLGRGLRH